MELKKAKK